MPTRSNPSDLTPSLFDDIPTAAPVAPVEDVEDDDWIEVPQAVFLSWSNAMQLHYCWRRDLSAAVSEDYADNAAFFLQRAAAYKTELDELINDAQ